MASAARTRLIPAILLLVVGAAIWWVRRKPPQEYPFAYVSDRSAIVWSTTAQVRERLADLKYGERVEVLDHTADQSEVRSDGGIEGWVDTQLLMPPDLWKRAADLLATARTMPVQASGHTRAQSNVHIEASRTATRVFQFGRNVPVVVLGRKVAPAPAPSTNGAPTAPAADADNADAGADKPKQEDWLLVLHVPPQASTASDAPVADATSAAPSDAPARSTDAGPDIPIAGWVLARFIELDPPTAVADYATSSAVRIVAWLVLNKVPADGGGEKPQYLVAGTREPEGAPCDFTALRVYTWGAAKRRYETAYVENDLCGQFPIRATAAPEGAEFRFAELDENDVERVYRMKQTLVRRVRESQPAAAKTR
jgi:hypothetical protein